MVWRASSHRQGPSTRNGRSRTAVTRSRTTAPRRTGLSDTVTPTTWGGQGRGPGRGGGGPRSQAPPTGLPGDPIV